MGERNELKLGALLNYLNMGLGALIPFFYTPIMLRILGQEEYGLYKLSGSVTSYLGLLSLGIGSAIVRNLIKARVEGGKEEEQRVFSLFVLLYRIIGVSVLLVGCLLAWNLDIWYADSMDAENLHKMKILVVIMALHSALAFVMGPWTSIITSHEKFIYFQTVGIVLTVAGPAFNLLALFLGYASIGIAVSSLLVSICGRFVYRHYVIKKLDIHIQYRNLPFGLIKEIVMFSFWIFLGQLTSLLYNSTDQLMIGSRAELGNNAVAVYSIGCIMTSMVFSFTTGITNVLAPRVNKMCFENATNEELTLFGIKVARIQLLIVSLLITGFIAYGRTFMVYYAGEGYADAYWVTVFTIIPLVPSLLQNVFLNVSMARFKHQFRAIVYLAIAVVNVGFTYLVLPYWGIIGAAFVTGVAGVIGRGFVMNWYYHKHLQMDTILFWKKILNICIVPIILCAIAWGVHQLLDESLVVLCIEIVVYTIVYGIVQYFFVMNDYEKQMITNIKIFK